MIGKIKNFNLFRCKMLITVYNLFIKINKISDSFNNYYYLNRDYFVKINKSVFITDKNILGMNIHT